MSGYFTEYPNGSARLEGVIRGIDDDSFGFHIDIQFRNRRTTGTPVFGHNPEDTSTSDWRYYDTSGILTGTGKLAGLKLAITTQRLFQIGTGANFHDLDFGASGWFYYTVLENSKCEEYEIYEGDASWQRGDINLDLNDINN